METPRRSSVRICRACVTSSNTHRRFSWPVSYMFPELNCKRHFHHLIKVKHQTFCLHLQEEKGNKKEFQRTNLTWCGSRSILSSRQRGTLRTLSVPSKMYWSTSPNRTLSIAFFSSFIVDSIQSMSDHRERTFGQPGIPSVKQHKIKLQLGGL